MIKRRTVEPEQAVESLVDELRPFVKELSKIRKQAEKLGLFVDDRELLACAGCGLMEDVAFDGRLRVYRDGRTPEDSGLRFVELSAGLFRCPSCGAAVRPEDPSP